MRSLLATAAVVLALTASSTLAAPKQPKQGRIVQAEQIEWKPLSSKQAVGGPLIHVLWGNPPNGAGGFLLKLSAEGELPERTHASAYSAVVISGTWVHDTMQGEPVQIVPGGYFSQPAKLQHRDRCVASQDDCVLFVRSEGKFEIRSKELVGMPVSPAPQRPVQDDAGEKPPPKKAPAPARDR